MFLNDGFPLKAIENVLTKKSHSWESEGNVDILDENGVKNQKLTPP